MFRSIRDWVFTIPFLIAFALILFVFDFIQRVAFLFAQRPQEHAAGWLQVALVHAMRLTGSTLDIERSPRVKSDTPYIIISNHQSMMDIPIFAACFFSSFPKYISKKSLAKWIPSISFNLRHGGNALIDRSDRDQALGAIRQLARQVRERHVSAVIFPEGTRARAGELGKFKPLGAIALMEEAPEVAVVPVCIDNSWRFVRNNFLPVPFGVPIRVWIGDPIERRKDEDPAAVLTGIEQQLLATLQRFRATDS